MRRLILHLVWVFIVGSCAYELECEEFDRSLEIAKWHLFPTLDVEYTFSSDNQEIKLSQGMGKISEFEIKECGGVKIKCDCIRYFIGKYTNDSISIECNIIYDQHENQIYRSPISYKFNGKHIWFEISSSGQIQSPVYDTTSLDPAIEYRNLNTITLDGQEYQNVLHLIMPEQSEVDHYWVARNEGLVAFSIDSVFYYKK